MEKNPIIPSSCFRKKMDVFLLKMKLLTILFFAGTMVLSAKTYSQITKIDLQVENSSLKDILKTIEQSSEVIFIYNEDVLNSDVKKDINIKGQSIEKVLETLFKGTDISYKIDDRQVFLTKEERKTNEKLVKTSPTEQQLPKKNLSGTVKDSKGIGLPGVTVAIKGGTIGTITDLDGKFNLIVPADSKILVFSFVGTKSQEIPIGGATVYNIVMKEEAVGLQDVVVVGYGVQKKQSVVGSIVQTNNEALKRAGGVTDLKQALTGLLPGVMTITSTGEPGGTLGGGSGTSIFIRGQNTWNGGQPLILVDNVERNMENIDVSEVETISVLKDASATAVFGVKGANGVILITTKRGSISKPKISFTYNATAKMISKLPKTMDSYNAILTRNEAIEREVVLNEPSWGDYIPNEIVNRYKLPQTSEYAAIYPNVDWEKAMFKDMGMSHRATLNVQGGTDFVNYFGSLVYLHEGDMLRKYENNKGYEPNYNFDRYNFRSNLDFKLTKTTNLKVDLSGYYSQKNTNYAYQASGPPMASRMWASAYGMPPDLYLPQYSNGRWGFTKVANNKENPVATAYNLGIRETRTTDLNSDFALEQKLDFITKGLSAEASLAYDNSIVSSGGLYDAANGVNPDTHRNTPSEIIDPALYTGPDQDPSEYTEYLPFNGTGFDWILAPWTIRPEEISAPEWSSTIPIERRMIYQFQIKYNRKFNLHNIGAMGVVKREEYANGSMFKNFREDWVFRTTYDYDAKYLFEGNGAYNGSEQFGPGYRFAFFPSVALGWNVSREKFFKVEWINKLKLRYSTGMVGDDRVSGERWLYNSQFSYGGYAILNQNPRLRSPYIFYDESVVGNPDIHWEKALKNNYGVEIGLFDNLISVNYDYFTEDRTDILLAGSSRNIPPYFGATPPSANLGHVKSSGYEIELNFDKRLTNGFHFWSTLDLTHTENKILEKDDPSLLYPYLMQKGYTIGQTRSQVRTEFYNNWDEIYASVPMATNDLAKLPGFYNILDFNADGVIQSNDDAVPVAYSGIPQNTFNFSLGADYKGFSIMIQLYGVNNVSRTIPFDNFSYYTDIVFDHVSDYWSKNNQSAASFLPRWKTQGENVGDYYVYDASCLRLKTAEIAYTFQDRWVQKAGLSALKIYLNGNNLFLWSKLPDDREGTFSGGSGSSGAYPTVKRITLGVDLTL